MAEYPQYCVYFLVSFNNFKIKLTKCFVYPCILIYTTKVSKNPLFWSKIYEYICKE